VLHVAYLLIFLCEHQSSSYAQSHTQFTHFSASSFHCGQLLSCPRTRGSSPSSNRAMHGSRTPAILFQTSFPSFRAANFDSQPTFLLPGTSILDRTIISILSQRCQLKQRAPHSGKSGNHELRYMMQHSEDYRSRHFLAVRLTGSTQEKKYYCAGTSASTVKIAKMARFMHFSISRRYSSNSHECFRNIFIEFNGAF